MTEQPATKTIVINLFATLYTQSDVPRLIQCLINGGYSVRKLTTQELGNSFVSLAWLELPRLVNQSNNNPCMSIYNEVFKLMTSAKIAWMSMFVYAPNTSYSSAVAVGPEPMKGGLSFPKSTIQLLDKLPEDPDQGQQ